ncbi:ShlB/FhaC/HecB family hemolysin secretion/activation protein [Variovorax saccharolyticus]|uniref:ShlB/FhaC/HecB family hemolysin secretion/activation protein n=1 Tax=Variovorax saccharolyticus TaxID=3053516 RepID=UPI00257837C1|nr:ShlB/FhaC/HecB family hemolysin secretion/activation protein [Variovorax sp. J31P216]MDM0029784.1 ShlB/FhaC/HecB family hemolysin secretion/activation protein [Variovorax sp. J31P216]
MPAARPPFTPSFCVLTSLALATLTASVGAHAQLSSVPQPIIEEIRQQERERALREQQERPVQAPPKPAAVDRRTLPNGEVPCFRIDRLVLTGERAESFRWALDSADRAGDTPDDWRGRCLGAEGVNIVLARVQRAMIAKGYVTTRVLVAAQDLVPGTLTLTLVPSRIAGIGFKEDEGGPGETATSLRGAIPARIGDLVNLRDIEQGLENLKRLPTADADIQIEASNAPDARPGDSDLVVAYSRKPSPLGPLRVTLSLDDGGTDATGKTQAGATVAWDGPLGLNDLLYLSLNHDAFNHQGQGTAGQTLHYAVPYGYWLLGATASQNDYHQSVAGLGQRYVYSGEARNAELKLARLIYRDAARKTTAALRAWRRASHNFVDDTEIDVQRRIVGGWEASVNHREFIGEATLDGTLSYRRGTGAFGSIEAPEAAFGEGTSRMKLFAAEASLNAPFKLGGQQFRYSGLWRAQWNRSRLSPQDRFAIGGRYTVRGFDGEESLLGERGWLLRNDLGWALGQSGAELYAGIDFGHIGGPSVEFQVGNHLAGGVIGLRGARQGLNYDVFIGAPIRKPSGFDTANLTVGFSLNYSF